MNENEAYLRGVLDVKDTQEFSLGRVLFTAENARTTYRKLPPNFAFVTSVDQYLHGLAHDSGVVFHELVSSPEFRRLVEDVSEATHGQLEKRPVRFNVPLGVLGLYASFLASDAPIPGRITATVPSFQEYVKKSAVSYSPLTFMHVIDTLERVDTNNIQVGAWVIHNLEMFAEIDEAHSWLQKRAHSEEQEEYKSNYQRKADNMVKVVEGVFSDVTSNENSAWRNVLLHEFSALVLPIMIVQAVNFEYDMFADLQSLKNVINTCQTEEDFALVRDYLRTLRKAGSRVIDFDQDFITGNTERVKHALSAFHTVMDPLSETQMENSAETITRLWIEAYKKGQVSQSRLEKAAGRLRTRYLALNTLPGKLIQQLIKKGHEIQLPSPLAFVTDIDAPKQAEEFIGDLIEAGLPITRENVNGFVGKEELLAPLSKFSQKMFGLDSKDFSALDIIQKTATKLLHGEIVPDQLEMYAAQIAKIKETVEHVLSKMPQFAKRKDWLTEIHTAYDSVFDATEFDVWIMLVQSGLMPLDHLMDEIRDHGEAGFIELHSDILNFGELIVSLPEQFRNLPVINEALEEMTYRPDEKTVRRAKMLLLQAHIIPTDNLIAYISENEEEGIQHLRELQELKTRGKFRADDPLQKDLEFTTFCLACPTLTQKLVTDRFSEITIHTEDGNQYLTLVQRREAEAAAYEAAQVYWLVEKLRRWGRDVIVIGNQRYGADFVTEPLRYELEELGANVYFKNSKVPSSNTRQDTIVSNLFDKEFISELQEKQPDLVIVDGTATSTRKDLNDTIYPRLPSAIYGYLNWFIAYNLACGKELPEFASTISELQRNSEFQKLVSTLNGYQIKQPYDIAYWVPEAREKIMIGSHVFPFTGVENGNPQVILANPVTDPKIYTYPDSFSNLKNHTPAFFDDREQRVLVDGRFAFTSHGLEKLIAGQTEEEFVAQTKMYMEKILSGMIRRTSPY